MVITIGVDAHKAVHVAVALDEAGRDLGGWRGPNSAAGWQQLLDWARGLEEERRWGIEGAWGNGRGFAQHLVQQEETVYEINARWTALGRRRARKPGKTDGLDAQAVALFVRQEAPSLPHVFIEDDTAILDILTTEREAAIAEATRLRNQIHALLLQTDPEYRLKLPSLTARSALETLRAYVSPNSGVIQQHRAASVRRLAERLQLALAQAGEVEGQIKSLASSRYEPLTRLCGINLLTAATLAGILGPGARFASDAQLAAYAGVAPIEASSAGRTRHRLNRGGNRRLNAVLYRITLTQAHYSPEARAYLDRRVSEGKTRREAHRCLRRYVIRAIWRLWRECLITTSYEKQENAA